MLDLDYPEDSQADTDMNVVMTADGRLVEVQATAERDPFSRDELDELLDLAAGGIEELAVAQRAAADDRAPDSGRPVQARLASANPHKLVELRRPCPGGRSSSSTTGTSRPRPDRPTRRMRAARLATAARARRRTPG